MSEKPDQNLWCLPIIAFLLSVLCINSCGIERHLGEIRDEIRALPREHRAGDEKGGE